MVADGERRVAAIAAATLRRPLIAGVWQPTITDGARASTRSTVAWKRPSSTSVSHGLT